MVLSGLPCHAPHGQAPGWDEAACSRSVSLVKKGQSRGTMWQEGALTSSPTKVGPSTLASTTWAVRRSMVPWLGSQAHVWAAIPIPPQNRSLQFKTRVIWAPRQSPKVSFSEASFWSWCQKIPSSLLSILASKRCSLGMQGTERGFTVRAIGNGALSVCVCVCVAPSVPAENCQSFGLWSEKEPRPPPCSRSEICSLRSRLASRFSALSIGFPPRGPFPLPLLAPFLGFGLPDISVQDARAVCGRELARMAPLP